MNKRLLAEFMQNDANKPYQIRERYNEAELITLLSQALHMGYVNYLPYSNYSYREVLT